MNKKLDNTEVPTSMQMPIDNSLSENSKHIRKEIDDWIKEGNEKVIVSANEISVSGKASCTHFSEKTVDLIGRGILNIYGGLVDVADGATMIKGSKGISTNELKNGPMSLLT